MIAETPRLPHVGEIFRQAVPRRAFQATTELLRAGQRAHLVDDVDLMSAARMVIGPLVVHALLNVLLVAPSEDEPSPQPMDADAHVELFLAAISKEQRWPRRMCSWSAPGRPG